MASKRYTNADLKPRGEPTTTYGPWVTKPGTRASMQDLAGGDSQDEILAGAKAALKRTEPTQGVRGGSIRPASMGERISSMAKEYTPDVISKLLWPIAKGAAVPAMFAGGGVGTAASLPMALEALGEFGADPSMGNALSAGVMALPGASALRGSMKAVKAGRAASEASGVAEGLFQGTGMHRAKNIPYQYPASRPAMQALDDAPAFTSQGSRSSSGSIMDMPFKPSGPATPSLPREQRAAFDEFIDLGDIGPRSARPAAQRLPLGARSRPNTREFAQEIDSIDNLSEQDIAELMDAIAWARR